MDRLLVAGSAEVALQNVISNYEFTTISCTLKRPDGSLHPTTDKRDIMHVLERLVEPVEEQQQVQGDSDAVEYLISYSHRPTRNASL